jgi:hypothetical protein
VGGRFSVFEFLFPDFCFPISIFPDAGGIKPPPRFSDFHFPVSSFPAAGGEPPASLRLQFVRARL